MEKKGIIGIVLALLVVIFLGVALIGPWYVMSNSGKTEFKLQESVTDGTTTKYSDSPDAACTKLYNNIFYITIVALVLGIIWLITALLAGIGKLSAKIVAIFMLLTMIFAIVAPIYFATALPGALKEDWPTWDKGFMGSGDVTWTLLNVSTTTSMSWGPGYGWYLAVVAFVLALIGLILVFLTKKAPVRTAP